MFAKPLKWISLLLPLLLLLLLVFGSFFLCHHRLWSEAHCSLKTRWWMRLRTRRRNEKENKREMQSQHDEKNSLHDSMPALISSKPSSNFRSSITTEQWCVFLSYSRSTNAKRAAFSFALCNRSTSGGRAGWVPSYTNSKMLRKWYSKWIFHSFNK